ncbi:MAG TPA: NAD/NADP octopine/nopaline dehydrogenase family protein [Gaiellaceae bacterium]|nr:NAD/NADP octopine/nopaline dehydrogenase family protein [Gaiellaceae bacterium]
MRPERVAVLGAGNGGCAAAADLARRGFEVRLFNRGPQRLAAIAERGGIELVGALGEHYGALALVTGDIREACADADVIMLCVPTSAYDYYARELATVAKQGQPIFLNPGHVGGGLYLSHAIRRVNGRTDLLTCECTTLTYGCRMVEPTVVNVIQMPERVAFAAFPGRAQPELFELARTLTPNIVEAGDVLETAFLCINAVEHPPMIVLNAGWVEATAGDYLFYHDGTTPAVGRLIDRVDEERLAVAGAAGIRTRPFVEYFCELGYTTERAVVERSGYVALQESAVNRWVKGPRSLDGRYMHEDVGCGLVPLAAVGDVVGVETPAMDALVAFASALNGVDYRTEGMTLDRLGLAGRPVEEWGAFVQDGL